MKRTRWHWIWMGFFCLAMFASCSKDKSPGQLSQTFIAMGGVPVEIVTEGLPPETLKKITQKAARDVESWENQISFFRPESLVNQIIKRPEQDIAIPDNIWEAFLFSKQGYEASSGTFDITVGPIIRLWKQAEKENRMPSDDEINAVKSLTGFHYLILDEINKTVKIQKPGVVFDFGGVAKGLFADWIADSIVANLTPEESQQLKKLIVNPGGDMAVRSFDETISCSIGIKNPFGEGLWGTLAIKKGGVVTSGTYERFFTIGDKKFCHIVDPRTGRPVKTDLVSVTVYDPSAAMADALATAVFVLGEAAGWKMIESRLASAMVIVRRDGGWKASPALIPLLKVVDG